MSLSTPAKCLTEPIRSTSTSVSLLEHANKLLWYAEKRTLPIRVLSTEGLSIFDAQGATPSDADGDAPEFLGRLIAAVARGSHLQMLLWGNSESVVTNSVKTIVSSMAPYSAKHDDSPPLFECRVTNSNADRERVPSFIMVGHPKFPHHGIYGLLIEESISMNPNYSYRSTLFEVASTPSHLQIKQSDYFDSIWSSMSNERKIRQHTIAQISREYAR